VAAQQTCEVPRHTEPQPGAARVSRMRPLHLPERIEDALEVIGGDADPGVADPHANATRLAHHRDTYHPARRELHGVREKIDEDLPELPGIGMDGRQIRR